MHTILKTAKIMLLLVGWFFAILAGYIMGTDSEGKIKNSGMTGFAFCGVLSIVCITIGSVLPTEE